MSNSVRIERAANGYTVEMKDPKIVAENNKKSDKMEPTVWKDPCKEYVFSDFKSMMMFLEKNLDKALPMDEYDSSFETAVKEK